jgi:hypothetical protein
MNLKKSPRYHRGTKTGVMIAAWPRVIVYGIYDKNRK